MIMLEIKKITKIKSALFIIIKYFFLKIFIFVLISSFYGKEPALDGIEKISEYFQMEWIWSELIKSLYTPKEDNFGTFFTIIMII